MKQFIHVFWELVLPYRKHFLKFFVLIAVYEFLQILDSYTLSFFIEINTNPAFTDWMAQYPLLANVSLAHISAVVFVLVLFYDELFIRFDRVIDWKLLHSLLYPVYIYLKETSIAKFIELDIPWHRKEKSGALVGKIQQASDKMSQFIETLGWELVPTLLQFILTLFPVFILVPEAPFVLIPAFVCFLFISARQYKAQRPYRKRRHKGYEEAHGNALETIRFVDSVQHNRMDIERIQEYSGILASEIRDQAEISDRMAIYTYGTWKMRIVEWARRIMLALLIIKLTNDVITVATLIFVWTLSERLIHSFWRIARLMDIAAENLQAAERMFELLNTEPNIKNPEHPVVLPEGPYEIAFENTTFLYDESEQGISHLNLTIHPGEAIGIVGESGAGKTTLRRMLMREVDVSSGAITLNGVDIRDVLLYDLHGCFAYVPQEASIFAKTFLYNIAFGAPNEWSSWKKFVRSVRAAKRAGIHEFIKSTEKKYDTVLGELGLELSGGQRQRVALARALVSDASILILDEPTSAIDSRTEAKIQKQLKPIIKDPNRTVIMIAHRLSTLKDVDRILVFDKGQLIEQGNHECLMELNGMYAEMYRMQAEAH